MKRREFLQTQALLLLAASGAVPGLTLFPTVARAEDASKRKFFVMIRAATGWDVTLGLDPKVHANGSEQSDMFIEYKPEEILSASGLRFGPACADLVPHAADLAVVNGVFMSDANVSHEANLDYISTGDGEGRVADLPAEIAYATSAGPLGVIFNQNLKRSNRNVMPTTVDNIVSLRDSIDMSSVSSFLNAIKSKSRFIEAERSLAQNVEVRTKLLAALTAQEKYLNTNSNSGGSAVDSTTKAGAVMACAFVSGAANQGLIDIMSDLDTHSGHEGRHLKNQTEVWKGVAQVFAIFKSVQFGDSSLFDHTTFMVVSEFARTPALNPAGGKDHNPLTNSVLLAGSGIRGGVSIGASTLITRRQSKTKDPRHVASPIDYATGVVPANVEQARAKDFQFIFPENVAATVADAVGVDRQHFSSARPDTASLKAVLKG